MKRQENGCFSELKETPALPQVKISSDLCAFCFHWFGICQNLRKTLGESVIIRYVFTVCSFTRNVCCLKGRKTITFCSKLSLSLL